MLNLARFSSIAAAFPLKSEVEAFLFFGPSPSVKAVAKVIVLWVGKFLECVGADVMIRDDETIGRDKRTAAAGVETHARFLEMIEPLLARLEVIFLL